jgi:hypothetical protein
MCITIDININDINEICSLFSVEMAERIREGDDHVLVVHRTGGWNVQFVEGGVSLVRVGFGFDGQETIEYMAGECPHNETETLCDEEGTEFTQCCLCGAVL